MTHAAPYKHFKNKDDILRADSVLLRESDENDGSPLGVFRSAAIDYLRSVGASPAEYEYRVVSLWALVHGLAVMLQNKNWQPEEPILQAVEKVLLASC